MYSDISQYKMFWKEIEFQILLSTIIAWSTNPKVLDLFVLQEPVVSHCKPIQFINESYRHTQA